MDKGLYIAMSGAKQNMLAQAARANNLANVNTTGFKADYEQARAQPVFGEHFPTRAYAQTERPATDLRSGTLIETGRALDLAIKEQGWLAVEDNNGEEAYTRLGELAIDAEGILRTSTGRPVLGEGGPITVPPAEQLTIGMDGTISIRPLGAVGAELAVIDRIKLVNPEAEGQALDKGLDGLFRLRDGGQAALDPNVQVVSGFVEASNVSAADELINILSLQRQYEMQTKMMKTFEENAGASATIMRMG
ncbi:flagellar basal-body rod protein FlgF [Allopseudospirillum japonicum]|uniref:Flagellar basal-body rod protein FlgF n=1 Tax=Allopseudospirillum japonicum TaxID=64971 RepID=A0A1H6TCX4_9GAMM|nr:flagellar basal-body rod protein FlgF [Allopseudospirillum japonicum]SEI77929.1 flagellar basal-body rod protein FlgF [Allopseudospirillum japonicum]